MDWTLFGHPADERTLCATDSERTPMLAERRCNQSLVLDPSLVQSAVNAMPVAAAMSQNIVSYCARTARAKKIGRFFVLNTCFNV